MWRAVEVGVKSGHGIGSAEAGAAAGGDDGIPHPESIDAAVSAAAEVLAPDDDVALRRTRRLPKKSKRRYYLCSITETS